jgi:hypothetical protein
MKIAMPKARTIMAQHDNTTTLYAALFGNLATAITKFIAAGITGGSAMLSEGVAVLSIGAMKSCCFIGKSVRPSRLTQNILSGVGANFTSGVSLSP